MPFFMCLSLVIFTALFLDHEPAWSAQKEWKPLKLIHFKDFDDVLVEVDGKAQKVFMIGLRPIRQTHATVERQKHIRKEVIAELKKSSLFGMVVIRKDKRLGLSIDTFAHLKHGFTHEWQPQKYPWCATGWFAYNFNLYFLHRKLSMYEENFGDSSYWKDIYARVVTGQNAKK